MTKYLLLFSFFFAAKFSLSAQCTITNIQLTPVDCNGNDEYFYMLDFDYTDPGSAGYQVISTYWEGGPFEYAALPQLIGPFPSMCNQFMDFVVQDIDNPNTCNNIIIPLMECCNPTNAIVNLVAQATCFPNNNFKLTIDFDFNNPGSDFFNVYVLKDGYDVIPGNPLFQYSQLPLVIENPQFNGDCTSQYQVFIFDSQVLTSTDATEVFDVCCTDDCSINGVEITWECNPAGGPFDMIVYPIGSNMGEQGFTLTIGNNVYTSTSGNNVVAENVSQQDAQFPILVCSNTHPNCCHDQLVENQCIVECNISEVIVDWNCNADSTMDLFFTPVGTLLGDDGFTVTINGTSYSSISGGTIVLENIFISTQEFSYLICSNAFPNCCYDFTIPNPCYIAGSEDCMFTAFDVTIGDCTPTGLIAVTFDYQVSNPGSLGYTIKRNGILLDTFDYGSPITYVLEELCGAISHFVIRDVEFPDCAAEDDVVLCCPQECIITDVTEDWNCIGDTLVNLYLSPQGSNLGTEFIAYINGVAYDNVVNGTTLVIENINLTSETIVYTICSVLDTNCCYTATFNNPCLDNATCSINDIEIEYECLDGDFLDLDIFINATNGGSQGYAIAYGGAIYQSGPNSNIIQIPNMNESGELIDFTVCSVEFPNCCETFIIENPCYENNEVNCNILSFIGEAGECVDSNLIPVTFFYLVANEGSMGFSISRNGIVLDTFEYSEDSTVTFLVEGLCGAVSLFEMKDIQYPECTKLEDLILCCSTNPCSITSLEFEYDCIEGDSIDLDILVIADNAGSQGYTLQIGGLVYQSEANSNLINLPTLYAPNEVIEFTICSAEFPTCCEVFTLENPCYNAETNDCNITSFNAVAGDCTPSGLVAVTFDYDVVNEGTMGYTITRNGILLDTFEYGAPITLMLEELCGAISHFVMHDVQFVNCAAEVDVILCCGDSSACSITGIEAEFECLEGDFLDLDVFVGAQNGGLQGYSIAYGGAIYQSGPNSNLIEIPNMNQAEQTFEVTVCSVEYPSCCETFTLENQCYEGGGNANQLCIINDATIQMEVTNGALFFTIAIDNNNLCNEQYGLWINDVWLDSITSIENVLYYGNYTSVSSQLVIRICPIGNMEACKEITINNPLVNTIDLNNWNVIVSTNTDHQIKIDNQSSKSLNVGILDSQGKTIVSRQQCHEHSTQYIQTLDWPSGIYFVKMSQGEISKYEKVVIVK